MAGFDSKRITSDAGTLLPGSTDQAIDQIDRLAGCFRDGRSQLNTRFDAGDAADVLDRAGQRGFERSQSDPTHDSALTVLAGKLLGLCPSGSQEHAEPAGIRSSTGEDELARATPNWINNDGRFAFRCVPIAVLPKPADGVVRRQQCRLFFEPLRNVRSDGEIAAVLDMAHPLSRRPARRFDDFSWCTLDSWSRSRGVVAMAEWIGGKANPRFVVISLLRGAIKARLL